VLGRDLVVDRRAVRRDVGMPGHESFLYEDLTVEENLRVAVRAARQPEAGIVAVLDQFGFAGRLAVMPVGRCSAGQRRRVALAALVARRPALWLLDEPHAGLDAPSRSLLGDLIGEAVADGAAVLLSSHEPELAVPLSDRVVVMSGGRITGTEEGGRRPPLTALPAAEPPPDQGTMGTWHVA